MPAGLRAEGRAAQLQVVQPPRLDPGNGMVVARRGDPTWRAIRFDAQPSGLGVAHLHTNDEDLLADPEIALPLASIKQLIEEGVVGGAVAEHVAVMGYQQRSLHDWRTTTAPEIAAHLREQGADGLILAPA